MASEATLNKISVTLLMNDGTTSTGGVKTKSVSMPGLNQSKYISSLSSARDVVLDVAKKYSALSRIPLYEIKEVQTYSITETA